MPFVGRRKVISGGVAAAAILVVGLANSAAPAGAAPTARGASTVPRTAVQQSGGVSPDAALGTPQLNKTGKVQEVIRELVQCGSTMFAVGGFTSINQDGTVYTRNNIFSFSASASASPAYAITSWAPDVNGQVNSIAFNGSNCADAYIGGKFTSVNGTAVTNIAEIDTTTGNVVPGFGDSANFEVWTIQPVNVAGTEHLIVGGSFTYINHSHQPYLASISPSTGTNDGLIKLAISGDYHFCAAGGSPCTASGNHTEIYNQQLNNSGAGPLDLLEGHFTSVGGLARQQIFMLNLATDPATVTGWTSPWWDGSNPTADPYYQCWPAEAFYIRTAAWSPDGSTIYTATTGYHPAQNPHIGATQRTGLCDSVASWPSTQVSQPTYNWIEYSGCDSYYSVAADTGAVYAAGHPRWADNPNDCDAQGSGAPVDYGLQGFDPSSGTVELNGGGTALYTMTRANAGYMNIIPGVGLWIASTNRYTVNKCGSLTGPPGHNAADHAGICLLPYTG